MEKLDLSPISIGADIEVFLINKEGEFFPAIGLIGGSKRRPRPITKEGHMVQEDNVAAEFNIPPSVVPSAQQFVINIYYVLSKLQELIPE